MELNLYIKETNCTIIPVSYTHLVDAAATSVYYKVKEPNFNKKDLKKYLEDRNEEILELEIALNKANNEILIDID